MIAAALRAAVEFAATSFEGARPDARDPVLAKWWYGAGNRSEAGIEVTPEKALGLAAFWRGCNLITNDVAKLPFHPYRRVSRFGRDGKEKNRLHPAYRILQRKANSETTARYFRKTITWHAICWGNGYAHIIRDGAGRPLELIQLDPEHTKPKKMDGRIVYEAWMAGQKRTLPSEDVFHLRGLGFDGIQGYPVLEVMADAIGMPLAARMFGSKFYKNGAVASGVVTMPDGLDEEAETRFVQSFKDAHESLGSKHSTIFLEDGSKFQQLTIPPEHAQFLETRQFENREVANILCIPPHKIGDPGPTSYNSLENLNQDYLDQGLDPHLCAWEDEANEKLLTEEEKRDDANFFEFNRNAVLQMDAAARTGLYSAAFDRGVMDANDWRQLENMEPIPSGNVRYVMSNLTQVTDDAGDVLELIPEQPPQPEPPPAEPEDTPEDDAEDDTEDAEMSTIMVDKIDDAHHALLADSVGRIVRRLGTQARKASKKGTKAFLAWLDDDYADQAEVCCSYLLPAINACRNSVTAANVTEAAEATAKVLDYFRQQMNCVVNTATNEDQLVEQVDQAATEAEDDIPEIIEVMTQ